MFDVRKVHIQSGELHVAVRATVISTVLGSCVSVCLFDPVSNVGGMNHFALPESPGRPAGDSYYGDVAMHQLLRGLAHRGAVASRCVAKLFGGAQPTWGSDRDRFAIGSANVAYARAALERLNIPVVAERTGGPAGMQIAFESWSGSVAVQPLRRRDLGLPPATVPVRKVSHI